MTNKQTNKPISTPSPEDAERIVQYLENELASHEREAFEAELSERPELAAVVGRMESADESLRAHFGALPEVAGGSARRSLNAPRQIIGIAALIAIVGALAFVYLYSPTPTVQLAHARGLLEGPFNPIVVCDTEEKFRQYGIDTIDVPLTADIAAAATANITLLGWRPYQGRYGDEALESDKPIRALLARGPESERIIVVFRARNTLNFETEETRGYYKHTDSIGGLLVDEISAQPSPVVLPLLGVAGR